MDMHSPPLRTCTKCFAAKDDTGFSPDRRNRDGLQSICKTCRRANEHARYKSGVTQRGIARRLANGQRVMHYPAHHAGMTVLKGGRPPGMTLSLINPNSESAYWGKGTRGERYRLSVDPADYTWESLSDNDRRGRPTGGPRRDPASGRFVAASPD